MKQLRKFVCLTSREQRLLVSAVLWLWVIRLGLWLLPFQTLRCLLASVAQRSAGWHHADQPASGHIAWAVAVASRYVPQATCLAQALAAQALLEWEGHPARLCIGVARGGAGRLEAHAWVEIEGGVVVGGSELGRYTPLVALHGERP